MDKKLDEETVEVKFFTKLPEKYQVTDAPFRVPVNLGRFGLSHLINHLLALDSPKPFDFLLKEEFLRTTLKEFLHSHSLNQESVLEIEYTEAVKAPKQVTSNTHDDWISSISVINTTVNQKSTTLEYISSSYDGIIKYWTIDSSKEENQNKSSKVLFQFKAHSSPIKALDVFHKKSGDAFTFVTASKDQSLRIWNADQIHGESPKISCQFLCKGHSESVESVVFSPQDANTLCSGSWDNTILLWNTDDKNVTGETEEENFLKENENSNESSNDKKKKKRKMDSKSNKVKILAPVSKLEGHKGCITSILWPEQNKIISSSWDHSIAIWDANSSSISTWMKGDTAVHKVDFNKRTGLIASAHSDNSIRIWDPRKNQGEMVNKVLKSHKGWVNALQWLSNSQGKSNTLNSDFLLVSGSQDKSLKIWDIRSNIPLHTLNVHSDKVLTVATASTAGGVIILSGGADCKLHVTSWEN